MMPIIRAAYSADTSAIVALLHEAALPTSDVAELLASNTSALRVAVASDDSGSVLAVGGLEICGNYALLRSVAVRATLQHNGVGQALVEALVRDAKARRLTALYLLTTTAERYFPRFGFTVVARDSVPTEISQTHEFASACPASATVMQLALTNVS